MRNIFPFLNGGFQFYRPLLDSFLKFRVEARDFFLGAALCC